MTNAERQKRYRDKKRGGPPVGRWSDHLSVPKLAESLKVGRTSIFMAAWIRKHAPDVAADLQADRAKVTPSYKRLRGEYDLGLVRALQAREDQGNAQLVVYRKDGQFVFEWVNDEAKPTPRKTRSRKK